MKKEKELLISGVHFDYKIPFFGPFMNQHTTIKDTVESIVLVKLTLQAPSWEG